ncbi:MAG TPA: glycosyltransferase family 4 protein [Nitrospiraceae bacterium]|jgi:glycosyltransferase involved in cell wall biosynthesis|nr:glycosyltransferase family 4 protein [Nitrospiraceae bacterium]
MSNPAAILMVANFADRVGGGEESLLGLVRSLDRRRLMPHVVVPAEGEMASLLRGMDVPVAILPMPAVRPWTLPAGWRCMTRFQALLASWKIRLVHAHGSRGALYAALSAKGRGVPVIWHVRIVDRDPWLDGLLLRLSSAVIVNSQATARRFAGRAGAAQKVHVIYNGVDLRHFSPGPPDPHVRQRLGVPADHPIVLFAGRLEQGKGPDLFLEAAAHIQKHLPAAYFVMAGEGPLRSELEARATEGRLPLRFVGYQTEVLPLLRLSSAVVVPSRQEAFGRILIEAMAAQVPVIATRVGGIPEVCLDRKTGLLVPAEDPGALAAAVLETLSDRAETRRRVKAAAELVRSVFSLEEHAARTRKLYGSLLRDGNGERVSGDRATLDERRSSAAWAGTCRSLDE